MSQRALCGGAHAYRNCCSLSSRLSLSANLLAIDLTTTPKTSSRTVLLFASKRSLHVLQNGPVGYQNAVSRETGRHWPRGCLRGQTFSPFSSTFTRATVLRSEPRRHLSRTSTYAQEQKDTKSKDQPPSQPPTSREPPSTTPLSSIRKVIPKVLPTLTPHENIYTVPNLLTFSRLVAAPFIGYAILHDAHTWALGLFAYAGVSDLLDGWIARRWKLQTVVGSIVDPMADKTLMTVLTVCLAYNGALPVWLATIILGRDVGLAITAIYYRWISLPPPKTFTRYWDFSLPSAEVRPTTISKYNTFLQLGLMGATMTAPLLSADVGVAMTAFQYLVATTTVWSGLSYVFSKDAVKILSQKKDKPKDP
ncbi:hypothetical protein M426DRAFT_320268 [Hypoxylon sp. CI-4A]|nr:hypothetical protein M426DRAFT_320268 [Hypoxylon sp. CI-4A]